MSCAPEHVCPERVCPERVSVIIPVAERDLEKTDHENLARYLRGHGFEVITASRNGRAASLNHGAGRARNDFLWFVHADTIVRDENITALLGAVAESPGGLLYFDLGFSEGGIVGLNAIGANMRSRIFGLPYGDQGFCMSKKVFAALGGYPDASYGEDMLLVRRARRAGVALRRIPSRLMTSARKYHEKGWLGLTVLRQWQMLRLLWMRI